MNLTDILDSKTLFVAHDSGGANILISLSKKLKINSYFDFSGPALNLLKANKILSTNGKTILKEHGIEFLVTGTSASSKFELNYLELAKINNVPSISVLDNWSDYRQRFIRNALEVLPDSIWVCDDFALSIAQNQFQYITINKIPNFYIEEILQNVSPRCELIAANKVNSILYVCEPPGNLAQNVSKNPNYFGYSEFEAISFFLNNLITVFPKCKKLIFRLHPSNPKLPLDISKIDYAGVEVTISNLDLSSDISQVDAVVGTNSMALFIGMLSNRLSISAIPPNGYPCTIPDKRIIDFKTLLV